MMNSLLLGISCLFGSGVAKADQQIWSQGTAHVLPEGRLEVGLFGPLRYGVKDGLELQVHPIWFFLTPHIALKKDMFEVNGWNIGVRESIVYPTFLLKTLARPGIGGVLAADSEVPHIINSNTQFLFTRNIGKDHNLTVWTEISLALSVGESNYTTIDFNFAYPNTAVYQNNFGLNSGIQIDGKIGGKFAYKTDLSAWYLPGSEGSWSIQESTSLMWRSSERFTAQAGYVFVYGEYPYGMNWNVWPTFDLVFGW